MTANDDREGDAGLHLDVLPPEALSMVSHHDDPAILLSRDYRILAANRAYRERYHPDIRLGVDRCHWVSHRYRGPCDQFGETCPLRQCLETDAPARVLHVHHCHHGPEHVDVELKPIRDGSGAIVAFLERIRTVRSASTGPGEAALIGSSKRFNGAIAAVRRVAESEVPVLLLGESGTGKELFARAVHAESPRRDGPFIPVECSGLTESLFESELFGHEAGSFTGARARKAGLVEAARGGTLFLDEIGDVPLGLQVKLLRLLETRTFRRVGSVERQHADFRLVCATHQDLKASVEAGRFRLDLYYRINAFPIRIPALRDRPDDIPALCAAFLAESGKSLSAGARLVLQQHPWPGNIRELRNVLQRAALLCDGPVILPEHLGLEGGEGAPLPSGLVSLEEAERAYLDWAASVHEGDRAELARALGISERTLYRKLAQLERA